MSRLDEKVQALLHAPQDEACARALYATVAGTELCLLLAEDAHGGTIKPKVFPLETGPVVLAFDSEDRLVAFSGASPFAALSGRALASLLAGKGLALGLNLGTGGEYILPPDALNWLSEQAVMPAQTVAEPIALHPPKDLPEALLPEIEARLAAAQGLAAKALLVEAEYAKGERRLLIGFVGAAEDVEPGLSTLIGEVLAIAGLDPSSVDIAFLPDQGEITARALAVGLVIDLPEPLAPPTPDPTKPPRLR